MKKLLIYSILATIGLLIGCTMTSYTVYANPPSFNNDFAKPLLNNNGNNTETLRNVTNLGINNDKTFEKIIKDFFYPDSSGQGGRLRDYVRQIGLIVFIAMLIVQGFYYLTHSGSATEIANYHINFLYIFLGGVIFFGATRILGTGLKLGTHSGGTSGLITTFDQSLLFQILAGLRVLAFFIAIILLIYTGWKIIAGMDDKTRFQGLNKSLLNIIIPLIVIKIIDYVYFIVQTPNFTSKASQVIIEVAKILGYILGAYFIVTLIYKGFRLIFGGGSTAFTNTRSTILAIFLGSLVIFIFLLIIYQLTMEFATP